MPDEKTNGTGLGDTTVLPELYQKKDFDEQAFINSYTTPKTGTKLKRRDVRRTNRFFESTAGQQVIADARAAHDAEEARKAQASLVARNQAWSDSFQNHLQTTQAAYNQRIQAIRDDWEASKARWAADVAAVEAASAPALVLKDAAHWNQVASQYGFKDYNAVAAWQKENGLIADGKFGANSYAKWAELNPNKVGTVPVIKPRTVVPTQKPKQDAVVPTIDSTSSEFVGPVLKSETPVETPTQPATFNLDAFAKTNNLTDFRNFDGKRVVRYDPMGRGDWFIDEEGKTYRADGIGGTLGEFVEATSTKYIPEVQRRFDKLQSMISASYQKQGGKMNRINYFQQGGAAPQQDMQQQVIALVQAAMQGDQKATETVNKIMEAAKAGDQQAMQIAQMIQEVAKQMQGQATAAKWGAKLGYIKSLKYAKGGKTCPECEKKVEMKACGGKKAKKKYFGGLI